MNCRSVRPHVCRTAVGAEDRPADARTAPIETSIRTETPSRNIRVGYRWNLRSPPSLVRDRASTPADGANPGVAAREPADGGPGRPRPRPQPTRGARRGRPNAVTASKKDAPVLQNLPHPDRLVGGDRGGVLGANE